ncbi:MAG TPA: condensation domain-containing protein [Aldersonia sp.]
MTPHRDILSPAAITALFARALRVESVGEQADFCGLGGDDAAALDLAGRVRATTGVGVRGWEVFDHPTPIQYRSRLIELMDSATAPGPPRPRRSSEPVPLGPAQENMALIERALGRAMFNVCQRIDVRGDVDRAALVAAVGDVAHRHEGLRIRLRAHGGRLVQQAAQRVQVPHRTVGVDSGDPEALVPAVVEAEMASAFDLTREPPIRSTLIEAAPDHAILILTLHHLSYDGRCKAIVRTDLARAYRARLSGDHAAPPPTLQLSDVMAWQHERAEHADEHLDYWRSVCCDTRRVEPQSCYRKGHLTFAVPVDERLDLAAAEAAVTVQALLATCYLAAIHELDPEGGNRLPVVVQLDNREWHESAEVVATLSNMVPIAVRRSVLGEIGVAAPEVHEALRNACRHQELPSEAVFARLGGIPDGFPRYGFGILEREGRSLRVPGGVLQGRSARANEDEVDPSSFDAVLELRPVPGMLECSLTYCVDHVGARRAAKLVADFRRSVARSVRARRKVSA